MKRVKLKRDMNHKNRLTLANSGGRFCYEVTNYRVDKFSFSDKLLLTFFFFFVQILIPTFAPVKITPLVRSGESRLLARINNGLFLCSVFIYFGYIRRLPFPKLITRSSDGLRCNFDELGEMVTAFPM